MNRHARRVERKRAEKGEEPLARLIDLYFEDMIEGRLGGYCVTLIVMDKSGALAKDGRPNMSFRSNNADRATNVTMLEHMLAKLKGEASDG